MLIPLTPPANVLQRKPGMRKLATTTSKAIRVKEDTFMMEWPPKKTSLEVRPLTDEEGKQIDKVLKEARALGQKILARRRGKPLPSSWK